MQLAVQMRSRVLFCGLLASVASLVGGGGCAAQAPAESPDEQEASCIGKTCGDPCETCQEGNLTCSFGSVLRSCDRMGRCVPKPVCGEPLAGPYDPCAGKACGDPCTLCAPDDPDCVETAVIKACDPAGTCVAAPVPCQ